MIFSGLLQFPFDPSSETASSVRELTLLNQLIETQIQRVEHLVATVAQYPDLVEQGYAQLIEKLLRSPDLEEAVAGRFEFVEIIDDCIRITANLEKGAAEVVEVSGRQVAGMEKLLLARHRLEALKAKCLEEWPALTREEVEAAMREEGWLDATEAFAEIAGVSVEAWKQQVEEHKRKYPNGLGE